MPDGLTHKNKATENMRITLKEKDATRFIDPDEAFRKGEEFLEESKKIQAYDGFLHENIWRFSVCTESTYHPDQEKNAYVVLLHMKSPDGDIGSVGYLV